MFSATTDPCEDGEQTCDLAYSWFGNDTVAEVADVIIGKPLAITGLALLGLVIRWALHKLVDRLVASAEDGVLPDKVTRLPRRGKAVHAVAARDAATQTRRVQRAKTMGDLLKSIITGILVAIIGTMVLSELGVNIAPIIASAGIVGVALGFGAQSLVKDFLSGIFMIFEDQYGVGDVVDVGEATGTIEAVSLRVTRLRDLNGTVWYVPNGEILRVGNMSQNWSRAVVDVNVAYGEDLVRVQDVLRDVSHGLWEDEDFRNVVIEEPEVTGVEMLAADSITLRVMVKTAPMEQWGVARELRQRIKARFDHEGIEIPFAQRVVWHREDARHPAADPPADRAPAGAPDRDA
ncbi:mechanosensitive ion channel family protein [Nocardioides sp. SOB77]|uniref:Mechanosensitive ion channel family protein n=1 Tax=Nocardioides oceani TaxID=3058369 RepID=A0ABT8FEQ4_9ACTN|nr:mechanosensitive ion channel family protein [Nocardioides oceani]MDN4172662.1 mechanosensitive ion channel family protein [Nocardioides oceani]